MHRFRPFCFLLCYCLLSIGLLGCLGPAASSAPSSTLVAGPARETVLQNGAFENTGTYWLAPWNLYARSDAQGRAQATVKQDRTTSSSGNYSARIDITQAGPLPIYVALYQGNISLTGGQSCTVTFSAKADRARQITVTIQQNYAPWKSYWSQNFEVTTSWQQYSSSCTQSTSDDNAEFLFNVGQQVGSVWFDDVVFP